jgi:hypothetical protein
MEQDTLTSPFLPGFSCQIAQFFEGLGAVPQMTDEQ